MNCNLSLKFYKKSPKTAKIAKKKSKTAPQKVWNCHNTVFQETGKYFGYILPKKPKFGYTFIPFCIYSLKLLWMDVKGKQA